MRDGVVPSNARHTVARKLLTVMWGMWKRSYLDGIAVQLKDSFTGFHAAISVSALISMLKDVIIAQENFCPFAVKT